MDFSLSGSVEPGGDVRILKQCRPILELGEDRHEGSRSMKLSRTDSFSSARQQQQESNSSPSPDDHHSSSAALLADPGGMLFQQQYSRHLFQQQGGSYPFAGAIKQQPHSISSPAFQQQQQQQLHYFPFTASQWAELEHQALIFKYMMARAPVPPELVIPIRRSLILSPSSATNSWSGFQLGVGSGSPMDAEPGRCRRTDGKKWRCSRPVVADQKYCERHMHRGRNRSRKAAEAAAAAAAAAAGAGSNSAATAATATSATNNGGARSSALSHQSSSGSKGGGGGGMVGGGIMETGMGSYHYPLQSAGDLAASKDHQRFVNGMSKATFDPLRPEQLLFAEVSGSCTRPLGGGGGGGGGGGSSSPPKIIAGSEHHNFGSMQIFGPSSQEHEELSKSPLIRGIERKPEALRHFFDDDWPRDSNSMPATSHDKLAMHCFKSVPSTGILSLALEEQEQGGDHDRYKARYDHRDNEDDHEHELEEEEDPYTNISLARISSSGASGDLLSDVLLKSSSCKPPAGGNAVGFEQQQRKKMILASPTGVLQKLTCFSDSSSSASSPGSVKNDANHAH